MYQQLSPHLYAVESINSKGVATVTRTEEGTICVRTVVMRSIKHILTGINTRGYNYCIIDNVASYRYLYNFSHLTYFSTGNQKNQGTSKITIKTEQVCALFRGKIGINKIHTEK